jgi:VWFA-related protein
MRPLVAARIALAGAAAIAGAQAPSDQPTRFPASVEEVLVDVVVSDRDGAAIGGLRRQDFVLSEDGVPQEIASFEAVEVARVPARDPLAPPPTVSANPRAGDPAPGRTFLVVFDDLRLTPAQGESAKRALQDFLRTRVEDEDRLLLVATGSPTWWGARVGDGRDDLEALVAGLRGQQVQATVGDSMSDAEAYQIVVQRDGRTFEHVLRRYKRMAPGDYAPPREVTGMLNGTECDPRQLPGGRFDMDPGLVCEAARSTYQQAVVRLRDTLHLLERGLDALAGVRGRKAAILVSSGFYHDSEIDEFRRVAEASRRANTPVSFLNASGLPDMPVEMTAQVGGLPIEPGDVSIAMSQQLADAAGADVVASDTGGLVVRNRNDLTRGLRRIADEARRYYLIGYVSTNPARDGKFRKIQVRLAPAGDGTDRSGWEVRARRGYYAPKGNGAPRDPDAPVREALASPFDLSGLPLRLAVYALEEKARGRFRCLLVGEVDVRALGFREEEGRSLASVDLAFTTVGRDGTTTEHAQRVDMKLVAATREKLARDGYVATREVELPAGVHQARMVVRDAATGRIGSVSHRVDIPASGSFRISTPIVSDTLEPVPKGTPPRLLPIARREFTAGGRLFLSLDVFGAERGDVSRLPRVSMGYEVIRPDGEVLTRLDLKPIDPTPEGGLHRLVGFVVGDAGPGEYRIEGQVVDEQTGRTLLFTEPFTVRSPGPSSGR